MKLLLCIVVEVLLGDYSETLDHFLTWPFSTQKNWNSCVSCTKARSVQTKIMVRSEPDIFHQLKAVLKYIRDEKKTEWVQNDAERCCIKRWFFLIYKHPIRLAISVSWYEIFILQLTYAKSQQVFFSKSSTRISRFMGHKKHNCNLNIF